MLTHSQDDDLAAACNDWQGGRNVGSSPLRAAARVLTGTQHYFTADYIDKYERRAAADTGLLNQARVLLGAVATAPIQTAEQWADATGVTGSLRSVGFAGRGLVARHAEDGQIADAVASGRLAMPLWGVSLDLDQAIAYGDGSPRWIFNLLGAFPAVAAWTHSGVKSHERELICGGRYRVVGQRQDGPTTWVELTFEKTLELGH